MARLKASSKNADIRNSRRWRTINQWNNSGFLLCWLTGWPGSSGSPGLYQVRMSWQVHCLSHSCRASTWLVGINGKQNVTGLSWRAYWEGLNHDMMSAYQTLVDALSYLISVEAALIIEITLVIRLAIGDIWATSRVIFFHILSIY